MPSGAQQTVSYRIDDIKSAKFSSRKQAFECLQLFNAKLTPPKKLKTIKEKEGSRVTYRCIDDDRVRAVFRCLLQCVKLFKEQLF